MSTVIKLLERLGQDSSLQLKENVEALLADANLDEELKTALLNKDVVSLERQLDVCPDIFCMMFPAEDEPKEDEGEGEEEKQQKNIAA